MTASEVFESVTGSGSSDFALLVQILNEHGPWCLIGGLAVNCYVEPVFTLDADILDDLAYPGYLGSHFGSKLLWLRSEQGPVNRRRVFSPGVPAFIECHHAG